MATRIRLYQRLNKKGGYALRPVEYSRNGSPIADKNATRFYLRFRGEGERPCIPAGSNVVEADAQRKVLEARLLNGVQVIAPQPNKADRKRLALEAEEYIKRSEQKKRKTYTGYKTPSIYSLNLARKPTSMKSHATKCSTSSSFC